MGTETILEDPRWDAARLPNLAEHAFTAVLSHLGHVPSVFEAAFLGCDDARIAVLNADFRAKPVPTNVLSWPETDLAAQTPGAPPASPEPGGPNRPCFLGDVALAYETCAREAREHGKTLEAHVMHLLVHGLLHLLGYDHIQEADAVLMEGLEVEILGNLGFADPYREA